MQKDTMIYGIDHEKENVTKTNARLIRYGELTGIVKKTGTAASKKGGKR